MRSIGIALAVLLTPPIACAQENYPNRPIRLIVPTGPGAGNDLQARLIAQPLGERLGQQVVVENRTGAATIIGSDLVAKAQPDGYTLLMNVSTLAINPATYKKMPYDAETWDMTAVLYAVRPQEKYFGVSEPGAITVTDEGSLKFTASPNGKHHYLTLDPANKERIVKAFTELASARPVVRQRRFRRPDEQKAAAKPEPTKPAETKPEAPKP